MDLSNLPAATKKHFDSAAVRAVETTNPETVLEELETSYLCDGLDNMVRAGGVAAAAIVASPQGMKASLTDEGFDADTYALCKTLVTMHEKKQERIREENRRRALESTEKEHGMMLASISGLVDTMLPEIGGIDGEGLDGTVGRDTSNSFGADGTMSVNANRVEELIDDNGNTIIVQTGSGNGVGCAAAAGSGSAGVGGGVGGGAGGRKKLPLIPPLAEWSTPEERKQAWRQRIQQILDVPQGSIIGKVYFVFISIVVLVSSITSVIETLPVVNPIVRPQYFSLWNGLEWFGTIVFTLDFIARLYVYSWDASLPTSPFQNFITFAKNPVNIIDFITLLPQYIQPAFTGRIVTGNLRTLRLLRLYKVVRRFQGFHRLSLALTRSFSSLVGPFAFLAACVFFLSAVLFAAERGQFDQSQDAFMVPDPYCDNQPVTFLHQEGSPNIPPDSPCPQKVISKFVSQWQTFWWSVVTMCTVGYGDFVPTTWVGRLVATITIIVGMVFFSMPIAVVGTNYTIAVQMTSKSEEGDREDALQREDQRDHELVGGATHPGMRLLKLLGELLEKPSDAVVGGRAPPQLNLCAPSLNDLYVIEGILESVVSSMIVGRPEAALPLWIAKWPGEVKESPLLRKREAAYKSCVISRPLILHLGSEGKGSEGSHLPLMMMSGGGGSEQQQHQQQNAPKRGQLESAAHAVIGTAFTTPDEGYQIPRVVVYTPEIQNALQMAEAAKEWAATASTVPSTSSNNSDNGDETERNALKKKRQQQQRFQEIPTPFVLAHHATMVCMRVWGEPTFLIFSKTSSKEGILKTSASNNKLVPPADFSLLQESVSNNLRRLFADGMVQSLKSFQTVQQLEGGGGGGGSSSNSATASSNATTGGGSSGNANSQSVAGGVANSQSILHDPLKQDFSIEQLVFRHSVLKQQQWLALELKPVRVKHGDILSFGAAHNDLMDDSVMLNYRFEDNSNGTF